MKKEKQKKEEKIVLLKKASEDVLELERYIKEFSVFLPLPVCLINSSKVIIDVNNALLNLSEYKESEIMGQKIELLFESSKELSNFLKKLFKEKKVLKKEIKFLTKNNKSFIVNLFASPRKNYQNNIVGYFLAFSDITELKELQNNLEEKVQKRTEKLRITLKEVEVAKKEVENEQVKTASIISNLNSPVIVIDNDCRLLLLNPIAKEIFQISEKLIGKQVINSNDKFAFEGLKRIIKPTIKIKILKVDKNDNPINEEVVIYNKNNNKKN